MTAANERRPFPLHTGFATARRVELVTPSMKRITLVAPEFGPDFGVDQPGEIITLGWADPGEELVLPQPGWRFPAGKREQHWRNYTVRHHRPGEAEIDVDFFLHGDLGRASAWAIGAEAGDTIGFAGPRTHWQRNPEADWSLLVADETGLPALMAILETLPEDHPAIAVAEVADDGERQEVETKADASVHWLTKRGRLVETIRELELPWGRAQVWGGGESQAMRAVRDELRGRSVARTVQVLGYWSMNGRF
jgi:NADPH-dependent ferric siderophore reductase